MKAFFLPVGGARRFCLFHAAQAPLRGAVLLVPPFAEEQNLTRRTVALQARAFAAAGLAVLQIDLYGCGDSEGEFGDASWAGWVGDVVAAECWLRTETGCPPVFWGVRAGCLLATQAAMLSRRPAQFVFWQPVVSGASHWRQFLRIAQAGELLAGKEGAASADTEGVGDVATVVEVAGYRVSPELQAGLVSARLDLPPRSCAICVEAGPQDGQLTPALLGQAEIWRAAGHRLRLAAVTGAAYWALPEAPDCPALISATTELLASEAQAA